MLESGIEPGAKAANTIGCHIKLVKKEYGVKQYELVKYEIDGKYTTSYR